MVASRGAARAGSGGRAAKRAVGGRTAGGGNRMRRFTQSVLLNKCVARIEVLSGQPTGRAADGRTADQRQAAGSGRRAGSRQRLAGSRRVGNRAAKIIVRR